LKLRPHHLLCLLAFRGTAYDRRFVHAMNLARLRFLAGETAQVLGGREDELCSQCPNLDTRTRECGSKEGVSASELDQRVKLALGLSEGDELGVDALRAGIEKLGEGGWARLCDGCTWGITLCPVSEWPARA
jgi:hypothetical protein